MTLRQRGSQQSNVSTGKPTMQIVMAEDTDVKAKPAIKKTQGTFAVPRYFIPEGSPAYAEAQKLFGQIKWRKQPRRADAIKTGSMPSPACCGL